MAGSKRSLIILLFSEYATSRMTRFFAVAMFRRGRPRLYLSDHSLLICARSQLLLPPSRSHILFTTDNCETAPLERCVF
ncbi:hypothetical protein BJV78DRAFT_1211981 [Lactifluus subvellereus]|nr:hypothetical protein BJV78DRAFT_1211981 [Lactifluus subvellereus]